MPNIWNGTMFGDLDWVINASRGFVSISRASCYYWRQWLQQWHGGRLVSASTRRAQMIFKRVAFYRSSL